MLLYYYGGNIGHMTPTNERDTIGRTVGVRAYFLPRLTMPDQTYCTYFVVCEGAAQLFRRVTGFGSTGNISFVDPLFCEVGKKRLEKHAVFLF